ncbi:MAG: hypothetical protein RW306_09325 [Geobacteraceae bacterium]|nr:hypothetical protein [Geobacteraceae bacterium]
MLANMDGVTAGQQLPVIPTNGDVMPVNKPPDESISVKSGTGLVPGDDCSEVLNSRLK